MSNNYGGNITRGEVVYILNRALNRVPNKSILIKDGLNKFTDIDNNKYYYEIIEASNSIK